MKMSNEERDSISLTIVDKTGRVHENAMSIHKEYLDFLINDYGQSGATVKLSQDASTLTVYEKGFELQ